MRNEFCLNGLWDFMPVYGVDSCTDLPQNLKFEDRQVSVPSSFRYYCKERRLGAIDENDLYNTFNYPLEWSEANTGVLKRMFSVPENMKEQRLFLKFEGISQCGAIYLNGEQVGISKHLHMPTEIEITGKVNLDGENELIVVSTGYERTPHSSGATYTLGLVGNWMGYVLRGIWQDCYLLGRPQEFIEDVQVKTSVRNKEMTLNVMLGVDEADGDYTIEVNATGKCGKEKHFGIRELCGGEIVYSWDDAILWDTENPYLYTLTVKLYNGATLCDVYTVRIGFREFWYEGPNFYLNGARINLRGDSWHFQGAVQQNKEFAHNWNKICKQNGVNIIRFHALPYPTYYLDAADEDGMLIMDETAIHGSDKAMDAADPRYIDKCRDFIRTHVKRDRNHASVVIWSLQNEMRWVMGRDVYKTYIPELMGIFHSLDGTRNVIIEGDNRLISKENTEIESMHYNIDGTIAQWDRTKPLTFGEHGGIWYLCPQNASLYVGLSAYDNFERSVAGMAIKESLFAKYARAQQVSGISTFNFANYFNYSMPFEDIHIERDDLTEPGCSILRIPQYSLSINNGLIKDYPICIPNPARDIVGEAYKANTIIENEYDSAFFDDVPLKRSFNIYNETLKTVDVLVRFNLVDTQGNKVYSKLFKAQQAPGELQTAGFEIDYTAQSFCDDLTLYATLYHGDEIMHEMKKEYKIYSASTKTAAIETDKTTVYYGGDKDYAVLKNILPNLKKIDGIDAADGADLMIIGSNIDAAGGQYDAEMERFTAGGGVLICLEQFKFCTGDLAMVKKEFFSAFASNKQHPALKNLDENAFTFWGGKIVEERPEYIIDACYEKPIFGDFTMILESCMGDYGDGGDLWTPLVEYQNKQGVAIFNQIKIMQNFDTVPAAAILLCNLIEYGLGIKKSKKSVCCLISNNDAHKQLLDVAGVDYTAAADTNAKLWIVDVDGMEDVVIKQVRDFAKNGGKILVLPVADAQKLSALTGKEVAIENIPTYHVHNISDSKAVANISHVDFFRYEKTNFSPRMVSNLPIAENTIDIQGGKKLVESITGTPWHDYYYRGIAMEYCRIPLVSINKDKKQPEKPYVMSCKVGEGKIVVSQLGINIDSAKNLRIYSRMIANMGGQINNQLFGYQKGDKDYAVTAFMTLDHPDYVDYPAAEAYFSDIEYSLNNLGEGVYGWMKKVERSIEDGFIAVTNGAKTDKYFMTGFVSSLQDDATGQSGTKKVTLQIDADCGYKVFVNSNLCAQPVADGEVVRTVIEDVQLNEGLNRLVFAVDAKCRDFKIRPVFKDQDGKYCENLQYTLTIDEVDPK